MIEVIQYTRDDIVWPFSKEPPSIRVGRTRYGHTLHVDPTPAYSHDQELALRTLEQVAAIFSIDWPVAVCLLPVEELGRTNGATTVEADYLYDEPQDEHGKYRSRIFGTIRFSGKRIPPHPAMTRYLIAHEYGHVVEEWLNKRNDGKLYDDGLIKRYAELRRIKSPRAYGAGLWHRTPGEVFANDFRILVCGIEPEFWPHPGVKRPEDVPAVQDWWAEQIGSSTQLQEAA